MRLEDQNWRRIYLEKIPNLKISFGKGIANCPFPDHEDRVASFSVFNLDTGGFFCHGCGRKGNGINFLRMMQAPGEWKKQIPDPKPAAEKGKPEKLICSYQYKFPDGRPAFQINRYEPKTFRFIHNKEDQSLRLPYHLEDVFWTDETLFLVEGEKDADNLQEIGFHATCVPLGASGWREEYTKHFQYRRFCLLPDNDPPGEKFMNSACYDLTKNFNTCKIVNLPGLQEKEDVTDFLVKNAEAPAQRLKEAVNDKTIPLYFSREQPTPYLERFKILVSEPDALLPNQIQEAAQDAYTKLSPLLSSLTPQAEEILNKINVLTPILQTTGDYARLLKLLKQLHETASWEVK